MNAKLDLISAVASAVGAVASVASLALSWAVLRRERLIEKDVLDLKHEEEEWHQHDAAECSQCSNFRPR